MRPTTRSTRRRRAGAAVLAHGDSLSADRQYRRGGNPSAQGAGTISTGNGSSYVPHARRSVDTGAQAACTLDDGTSLPFDRLLIATGSGPGSRPPIPGIDLPGVHALLDAGRRATASCARPRARACCRWAPASSAASSWRHWRRAACKLTVVEMGDRMVPRMMGPTRRRHDQATGAKSQGRDGATPATRVEAIEAGTPHASSAVERQASAGRSGDQRHGRQAEHRFPRGHPGSPACKAC